MTTAGTVSSYQVREELEDLLQRDLLGPWDGEEEELSPRTSPAERYLLGRLVPAARADLVVPLAAASVPGTALEDASPEDASPADNAFQNDPSLVEREVTGVDEPTDGDVESQATIRSGSRGASSMGLSFVLPSDVPAVRIEAGWGVYERAPSEFAETEQGRSRRIWKRRPAGGFVDIACGTGDPETDLGIPDGRQDQVVLRWTIRHRGAIKIVDVALINGQHEVPRARDTVRLYQVQLTVTAIDGASAVFVPHNDPVQSFAESDDERRDLAMLYRSIGEFAHGRLCAAQGDVRTGEPRAWRLRTTCFPEADVPMVTPGESAHIQGLVLDMQRLGSPELANDELIRVLEPLVRGYRHWLGTQRVRLDDPDIARYAPSGGNLLGNADTIADRLERAIGLLASDGKAREAFRFANQAMALQRVRSEVVRARANDQQASLSSLLRQYDIPKNRSWRPFQLAFVLLCLPGLTDPAHPDALRGPADGTAQLLFFPTGGGKTEAYLGLTAYTLAIRRLNGVVGVGDEARDGRDGVAVLMRYTLRLLTAQQFQRAAALMCACEWLRRERLAGGDSRWGATPFRLGLWVGASLTPNTYENAKRDLEDRSRQSDAVGGVLQLTACPWCGLELGAGRDVQPDDALRRILTFCPDPEGDCPFSRKKAKDEGLPVVTVDEELYRLTPSLIIGTVDKFAQLPWKAATATLFGQVAMKCARHGWINPQFEAFCKGRHPVRPGHPAAVPERAMRLRPPDLIIQDELHLISDALGSMVGLYETVIDDLCTRTDDGRVIRPVLVASTATVRRAKEQVEQVFARRLSIFPPPALDANETFFSSVAAPGPETPARRYRGICAPGENLKSVEIRLMSTVLEHGQYLLDRYQAAADPYMTVVDYFTSTRELAGMRRLVDDDVAERLSSHKVRTRRRRPAIGELTSRMPSDRITTTFKELERTFDPDLDSSAGLERFRKNSAALRELPPRSRPLDVLLATSMLQVGLDIGRLGLMVVTGQPKNTAEYIQATSRVGRTVAGPGLVLTILQWTRPRDLGHFERFHYNHQTFGMRVEGVTTTPFSDRALDRGLAATVVAAIRLGAIQNLPNAAAHRAEVTGPNSDRIADLLSARAGRVTHDNQVADDVGRQTRALLDSWQNKRSRLLAGVLGYDKGSDIEPLLSIPDTEPWRLFTAPTSMREVENEILLQLQRADPSMDSAPNWSFVAPNGIDTDGIDTAGIDTAGIDTDGIDADAVVIAP